MENLAGADILIKDSVCDLCAALIGSAVCLTSLACHHKPYFAYFESVRQEGSGIKLSAALMLYSVYTWRRNTRGRRNHPFIYCVERDTNDLRSRFGIRQSDNTTSEAICLDEYLSEWISKNMDRITNNTELENSSMSSLS